MRIMTDIVVGTQKATTDGETIAKQSPDAVLAEQDSFATAFEQLLPEKTVPPPSPVVTTALKAVVVEGSTDLPVESEAPVVDVDVGVAVDPGAEKSVPTPTGEPQLLVERPTPHTAEMPEKLVAEPNVALRNKAVQVPPTAEVADKPIKLDATPALVETPSRVPASVVPPEPVFEQKHQVFETTVLREIPADEVVVREAKMATGDPKVDVQPPTPARSTVGEVLTPKQPIADWGDLKEPSQKVETRPPPEVSTKIEPERAAQVDQKPIQPRPESQNVPPKVEGSKPAMPLADGAEQLPDMSKDVVTAQTPQKPEVVEVVARSDIATKAIPTQNSGLVTDGLTQKLEAQIETPNYKRRLARTDSSAQPQDRQPAPQVDLTPRATPTPPTAEVTLASAQLKPAGGEVPILGLSELGGVTPLSTEPARGFAPIAQNPVMPGSMPPAPQQVAYQISQIFNGDAVAEMDIRLDPEELGSIRLVMAPKETGMVVTIYADRPDTLELLRRNSDQLSQHLGDLGYSGTEFEFHDQRKGHGGDGGRHGSGDDFDGLAPAHETATNRQIVLGDGMDLRF